MRQLPHGWTIDRLLQLVDDLTDDGTCWFDHHGGCQEHGYLSLEPGETCPHAEAKQLLADAVDDPEAADPQQQIRQGVATAVVRGLRNGEVHRRAALDLLQAAGYDEEPARDLVHAVVSA